MSWPAKHPGPWHVSDILHDFDIVDANGTVVARPARGYKNLAEFLVDAVNNADSWRSAYIKARTERNAFLLERDRLRDLVGKLAQRIQFARLADPNPGGEDPLLREAAAVCKQAREEART